MAIELSKETRARLVASIRRYAREELDEEMGDLKADLLLDFVLREVAPSVYNQAVADAQRHLAARLEEMSGVVYEPEFAYWPRDKRA